MIKFSNILKEIKITPALNLNWKNASIRRLIAKVPIRMEGDIVIDADYMINALDLGSYYCLLNIEQPKLWLFKKEHFEDDGADYSWFKEDYLKELIPHMKDLYNEKGYEIIQ